MGRAESDARHRAIHGVVFSGGSAFGLESASGVRRFLEHKGVGFKTGAAHGADRCRRDSLRSGFGKERRAADARDGRNGGCGGNDKAVVEGAVGAGTGATVGKILGMKRSDEVRRRLVDGNAGGSECRRDGIGSGGGECARRCARSGDRQDRRGHQMAAGSAEFADSAKLMKNGGATGFTRENTTLVVVATNATLNKVEANKLAHLAHNGMARAINPVNTMSDGDLVLALSFGTASRH